MDRFVGTQQDATHIDSAEWIYWNDDKQQTATKVTEGHVTSQNNSVDALPCCRSVQ